MKNDDSSGPSVCTSDREGILSVECSESQRGSWGEASYTRSTWNTETIERYRSSGTERASSYTELGDEEAEASNNVPPKQSPWARLVGRLGKPGAIALCICVPAAVVAVVAVVCCFCFRGSPGVPQITLVDANGVSQGPGEGILVDACPVFTWIDEKMGGW